MNIIFTIQHPAHVHLFRNSIEILSQAGHDVHTLARKKDINIELMKRYGIEHRLLAEEAKAAWQLPFVQLKYEWRIMKAAQKLDADVLVSVGEPAIAHAGKLSPAMSFVFTDTEHATLQNILAFPFADRIYTPTCYEDDIGSKQIRYPAYHELAYLHPDRFEPDPSVVEEAGLDKDDRFVIMRLIAWDAMHDVGDSGIDNINDVVSKLEDMGVQVLITSEAPLPESVEYCQISIDPHRIHHLMHYADMFIGESATMATECAILGTPAVFISSSRRGYTDELEENYNLVFNFSGPCRQSNALKKSLSILENYSSDMWQERRQNMLEDKIDTTSVIVNQIEKMKGK